MKLQYTGQECGTEINYQAAHCEPKDFIVKVLLLIGIIYLTACANNKPYGSGPASDVIADLPHTGIFVTQLSDSLRDECLEFKDQSLLHYCKENSFELNEVYEALNASGRFASVFPRDFNPDYQILISSAAFQFDDADSMANAIVSGASLMLVPMKVETTFKAEFTVMWRGNILDKFSHEIPVDFSFSLLTSQEAFDQYVAKAMADVLLKGIDEHGSMSPGHLVETLEASDYGADLTVTESVADFRLIEGTVYRDPLLGTMLRFNHQQFAFDRIDVFVYPIRATDWRSAPEVIGAEMENIRSEINYVEQEGHINNVELSDADLLHWKTGSTNAVVGFMDGHYVTEQSERMYTSTYVFIKEDKFVKVRASFPKNEDDTSVAAPDEFVRTLIPSISVPEESLFMARLRKSHRDRSETEEHHTN